MGDPSSAALIEGVNRHRLAEVAEQLDSDLAGAALAACRQIERELADTTERLRGVLHEAGVAAGPTESGFVRQNHTITFLVDGPDVAEQAVAALRPHGYRVWERWSGAARRSFRHHADQMTAARTDDHTTVVRFRWNPRRDRSVVERALTPTSGDWSLVTLPDWAWRGYSLVRLGRLGAERVGLRPRHRASLGPFLATPDSLLDALFDHAGLTAGDTVVDLGCGDGRLVIEAAERRGCRGVGIEHDADLVAAARANAARSPASDRIRIVDGDARTADVSSAAVVFLFLPIDVVADLVHDVLLRMRAGATLIAHEQSRLPAGLVPDESTLLVGANAVTVAHTWTAG